MPPIVTTTLSTGEHGYIVHVSRKGEIRLPDEMLRHLRITPGDMLGFRQTTDGWWQLFKAEVTPRPFPPPEDAGLKDIPVAQPDKRIGTKEAK